MKWYGWGDEKIFFRPEEHPDFRPYLEKKLGLKLQLQSPVISFHEISLPPCRLSSETFRSLRNIVGDENVSADTAVRITHSMGKSYLDLLRVRRGQIENPCDAVVWPLNSQQVQAILSLAAKENITIVPFGGGTSVVGGVEAMPGTDSTGVVVINLRRMNRLLNVDPNSQMATAEAGILGPELESALNQEGFTAGHFPQSFEYSTLGGWVATRSAGQFSTFYGKIEDMIVGLQLVTSQTIMEVKNLPASASGPSLKQMLIGSEGILGIITQATLRIHPLPEENKYSGFYFKDFEAGIHAIREIIHSELRPSLIRLSDSDETEASLYMQKPASIWINGIFQKIVSCYLPPSGCILLIGLEGPHPVVKQQWQQIKKILRRYSPYSLGASPARAWLRKRFALPYMRDWLLDYAIMIDTLETATTWNLLIRLYQQVRQAILEAIHRSGMKGIVLTHISHVYHEGASLYFTFLAPQKQGDERQQWFQVKKAATEAILLNGGTISHHHGIGRDHACWLQAELGPEGIGALKALKQTFDPKGILNPGKLLP